MTSSMRTILIIGGTSGLGEAFARRFHALGKKVIVTGHRADRLSALAADLPGLETRQWDITDFSTYLWPCHVLHSRRTPAARHCPADVRHLKKFSFLAPDSSTPESVATEFTTNVTAPVLLIRLLPHLASLSDSISAHLILVSSGLAFIPLGLYPVYILSSVQCDKGGDSLSYGQSRQQVSRPAAGAANVKIVELAPPYVDTDLEAEHRKHVNELSGGEDKSVPPTPLADYIDTTMKQLEGDGAAGLPREITTGFSQMGVDAWRGGVGKR